MLVRRRLGENLQAFYRHHAKRGQAPDCQPCLHGPVRLQAVRLRQLSGGSLQAFYHLDTKQGGGGRLPELF